MDSVGEQLGRLHQITRYSRTHSTFIDKVLASYSCASIIASTSGSASSLAELKVIGDCIARQCYPRRCGGMRKSGCTYMPSHASRATHSQDISMSSEYTQCMVIFRHIRWGSTGANHSKVVNTFTVVVNAMSDNQGLSTTKRM